MTIVLALAVAALTIVLFGAVVAALLSSDRVGRIAVGDIEFERRAQKELDEAISGILMEAPGIARQPGVEGGLGEAKPGAAPVAHELALMRKYHAQGLAQSRLSFLLSLVFAGLGFAVIVFAIVSTDSSKSISAQSLPFASLVSAVVIEAVSALFFVQSNRAQKVMVEFFDRLRADRKLEEALALADRMPDEKIKARMMLVLGIGLADRPITDRLMRVTMGVGEAEVEKVGEVEGVEGS